MKVEYLKKIKQGKVLTSILDKVLNHKQLKILTPKQMPQILPIALAQVKAGNTYEKLLNEIIHSNKLYIFCIEQKKLLKIYTTI